MSIMLHQKSPPPTWTQTYFTIPEAAWVADIDQVAVRNEIKRNIVRKGAHSSVLLDWCDVSYLRCVRDLHTGLGVELRRKLHDAIRENMKNSDQNKSISFGFFKLCLVPVLEDIDKRYLDLKDARELVSHNPSVKGGDYVIKNTRIPARLLAEIHRSGSTVPELSKAYSLTERDVRLAILFDELHPRVGRPRAGSSSEFTNLGDVEREDIEYLGELRRS